MVQSLPPKPNIENLKKQAKRLLKAHANLNDPAARAEAQAFIQRWHPKPDKFSTLRDAQLAIARGYGQQNWSALDEAVELARVKALSDDEKADRLIHLGCVQYQGSDQAVNYVRAQKILDTHPTVSTYSFYTALVTGNTEVVAAALQSNPMLARQRGGPLDWPALLYVTYSRIGAAGEVAIATGLVDLLLSNGADPNAHVMLNDIYRFTALTGAMGEGEAGVANQPPHPHALPVARLLLERGADPNDGQGLYNTMFADNASRWLQLLHSFGLQATDRINWDQSDSAPTCFDFLLGHAVKNGLFERIKELVAIGADVNCVDDYERRPVHTLALFAGHNDIAQWLSDRGARHETLTQRDNAMIAIAAGAWDELQSQLAAAPNLKEDALLLHHAANRGSREMVWQMLDAGFAVDGTDAGGMTLLHSFAWNNDIDGVKQLLQRGADTTIRSKHYDSPPLGHAAYNRAMEVVAVLADQTDDVFEAVCCARAERTAFLLDKQPGKLTQRTPKGNTLLHVVGFWLDEAADESQCAAIMDDLIRRGLDSNVLNDDEQTPADMAADLGNETLVNLLQERGSTRTT